MITKLSPAEYSGWIPYLDQTPAADRRTHELLEKLIELMTIAPTQKKPKYDPKQDTLLKTHLAITKEIHKEQHGG